MTILPEMYEKQKKILIITASGGGGLLQAAKAKEQEILAANEALIIKKDLLKDLVCKPLGYFGIHSWNNAQRKGDVRSQNNLFFLQAAAEILFWPEVFYKILRILFKENIDKIIDTQPVGLAPIIKAIRIYNKIRKKNVILEKVVVDLPTKRSTHFFRSVKRLSKKDKKYLKLISLPPMLDEGQTEDEFWMKNCRLKTEDVSVNEYPIRLGFKKFVNKKRKKEKFNFFVKANNFVEAQNIENVLKKGSLGFNKINNYSFEFEMLPNEFMITIVLGSNPANVATINYVKEFIKIAKQTNKKINLFVFCLEFKLEKDNLFNSVISQIINEVKYPKNLTVIPMPFQDDENVASLFFRSDLTITRSGGQTIVELMSVSKGVNWIHSEAKRKKNKEISKKELLRGIPGWEAGNALYFQTKNNSDIVTPEILEGKFGKLFIC